jgi:hypothetical protein
LSREFLKKLRLDEREIAFEDMEAGVEHFTRGIDEEMDKIPHFRSGNFTVPIRHFRMDTA